VFLGGRKKEIKQICEPFGETWWQARCNTKQKDHTKEVKIPVSDAAAVFLVSLSFSFSLSRFQ